MTDDPIGDLLARTAQADRAAFRALYSAAGAKLMGVLFRILRDRAEAEEALQEVFVRVWKNASRYDPTRGRGMTWLIAVARNHAIDILRARPEPTSGGPAAEAAIAAQPDSAPGPEARLVARSEARRISECLDQLEASRAQAVKGAYLDGLSYAELAGRYSVPLNTMRTWLRRSLMKLRECLEA